jgi:hypothetical protein
MKNMQLSNLIISKLKIVCNKIARISPINRKILFVRKFLKKARPIIAPIAAEDAICRRDAPRNLELPAMML